MSRHENWQSSLSGGFVSWIFDSVFSVRLRIRTAQ
jgi:hypothetical protein